MSGSASATAKMHTPTPCTTISTDVSTLSGTFSATSPPAMRATTLVDASTISAVPAPARLTRSLVIL